MVRMVLVVVQRGGLNLPAYGTNGFTLVELLVVMSIIAVGLALSAEPLRDLRDRNRLSGEVARFQESLRLARTEAVMRNIAVSLCPSHMASSGAPVCNGDYGEGWIVFSNADRDRNVDAEDDEVLRIFEGLPPGFRVTRGGSDTAAANLINYLPDGTSRNNQTLRFCPPPGSRADAIRIVINSVGRHRLETAQDSCTRRMGSGG